MTTIRPLIITITIFTASISFAAQTSCPEHFAGGQAPDFINQKLTAKTRKAIPDPTLTELESTDLPDKITLVAPDTVENPFA